MKVKMKVKLDRIVLWCCDLEIIKPFPAPLFMICPNCGTKKPSQVKITLS